MKLVEINYSIFSMHDEGHYLTLAEANETVQDIEEREKKGRLKQFSHLDLVVNALIINYVNGHEVSIKEVESIKEKDEWEEIWKKVYAFQETLPNDMKPTKENAEKLGLMITRGRQEEALFINKSLSEVLFKFRISN